MSKATRWGVPATLILLLLAALPAPPRLDAAERKYDLQIRPFVRLGDWASIVRRNRREMEIKSPSGQVLEETVHHVTQHIGQQVTRVDKDGWIHQIQIRSRWEDEWRYRVPKRTREERKLERRLILHASRQGAVFQIDKESAPTAEGLSAEQKTLFDLALASATRPTPFLAFRETHLGLLPTKAVGKGDTWQPTPEALQRWMDSTWLAEALQPTAPSGAFAVERVHEDVLSIKGEVLVQATVGGREVPVTVHFHATIQGESGIWRGVRAYYDATVETDDGNTLRVRHNEDDIWNSGGWSPKYGRCKVLPLTPFGTEASGVVSAGAPLTRERLQWWPSVADGRHPTTPSQRDRYTFTLQDHTFVSGISIFRDWDLELAPVRYTLAKNGVVFHGGVVPREAPPKPGTGRGHLSRRDLESGILTVRRVLPPGRYTLVVPDGGLESSTCAVHGVQLREGVEGDEKQVPDVRVPAPAPVAKPPPAEPAAGKVPAPGPTTRPPAKPAPDAKQPTPRPAEKPRPGEMAVFDTGYVLALPQDWARKPYAKPKVLALGPDNHSTFTLQSFPRRNGRFTPQHILEVEASITKSMFAEGYKRAHKTSRTTRDGREVRFQLFTVVLDGTPFDLFQIYTAFEDYYFIATQVHPTSVRANRIPEATSCVFSLRRLAKAKEAWRQE